MTKSRESHITCSQKRIYARDRLNSSSKSQSRSITETKQRFKILDKQVRTKLDLADGLRCHKQCFQQYILELRWIQESEPNQNQSLLIACKWSLDSLCSLINSNLKDSKDGIQMMVLDPRTEFKPVSELAGGISAL